MPGAPSTLRRRVWWLIILLTCFVCNILLIERMWSKFNESPPEDYAIFEIPFPAITICNEIKIKKSFYDALKDTEEGQERLINLKLIEKYSDMTSSGDLLNLSSIFGTRKLPASKKISPDSSKIGEFSYENSTDSNSFSAKDGIDFLIEATPSLSEMLTKCVNIFTLSDPDCEFWFEQVITDLGVCYSANHFPRANLYRTSALEDRDDDEPWEMDWLPEIGQYKDPMDHLAYPYRAFSNGRLFGLSIELRTNVSEIWEHRNNEENSGFKVVVLIKPVINTISKGVKAYKLEDRKCYGHGEKWLSFFQVYTQTNCELECLTNFTLKVCNCVAVHMPRNDSMRVCSPALRECVLKAEIDIMVHWKLPECQCWPSCFSIEYKASLQLGNFQSNSSRTLEDDGFKTSKMVIFFEDNKFPDNQRREIVDFVDFVSNCGGLLGLFSGMSILSFCEIFYYLTLRQWNIRLCQDKIIAKAPDTTAPKDSPVEEST